MFPPIAKIHKKNLKNFGVVRQDDYYWLNKRDDTEVLDYIKQENEYCDAVMKGTQDLQEQLFSEIKNRIKEDDNTVPCLNNGFWY
jgi:oligopeptidase B